MLPIIYTIFVTVVAIFFILLGILGIIIPWSDTMRSGAISFLENNWIGFFLFGIALITVGSALLSSIVSRFKRRYYIFSSDGATINVDEKLLEAYARNYWKERFPNSEISCYVKVRNKDLLIVADLPAVETDSQNDLILDAQQDLSQLFKKYTGFTQKLKLQISFGD